MAPRKKRAPEEPPTREPLTRERIVAAALALVDLDGAGALSMRRLGVELGVDPMAVYYHIPNKGALLDAIVEAVMSEIDLREPNPSVSGEERVLWAARAYRDAMLRHAKALPIVLSRGPRTHAAMRPVEVLVGILREAGLPPDRAVAGMNAIAAAVRGLVGMAMEEQESQPAPEDLRAFADLLASGEFPYLSEAAAYGQDFFGEDFEFGVRALARGLLQGVQPPAG